MDIAKRFLEGVSVAGNESVIPDKEYDKLLERVFRDVLTNSATKEEMRGGASAIAFKQAHSGLMTLILEAARSDAEDASIISVMDDCQYPQARINSFLKKYHEHCSEIQQDLSANGRYPPHIVNVDWRQDYIIKSNWVEKEDHLQYLIRLHTEQSNEATPSSITFSCTVEELQDLVSKLKEATKCLERNAQT